MPPTSDPPPPEPIYVYVERADPVHTVWRMLWMLVRFAVCLVLIGVALYVAYGLIVFYTSR